MKRIECQSESGQLLVGDLDGGFVGVFVDRSLDDETCFRRGCGHQVDNDLMAHQGTATPVVGDETEEAMLNLVPLARAWRKMADPQLEIRFVRQFLERHLPKTGAVAVTPASIGGNQQLCGSREPPVAHRAPPSADAVDGELGRVVVDAHAAPSLMVEDVVHIVGNGLARRLVDEVVNADLFGFATGVPLAPGVLEIASPFLLFRVHRDRRLATAVKGSHRRIDVLEWSVAVGMRGALPRFAVGLQAVTGLTEQRRHRVDTNGVMTASQLLR